MPPFKKKKPGNITLWTEFSGLFGKDQGWSLIRVEIRKILGKTWKIVFKLTEKQKESKYMISCEESSSVLIIV